MHSVKHWNRNNQGNWNEETVSYYSDIANHAISHTRVEESSATEHIYRYTYVHVRFLRLRFRMTGKITEKYPINGNFYISKKKYYVIRKTDKTHSSDIKLFESSLALGYRNFVTPRKIFHRS